MGSEVIDSSSIQFGRNVMVLARLPNACTIRLTFVLGSCCCLMTSLIFVVIMMLCIFEAGHFVH